MIPVSSELGSTSNSETDVKQRLPARKVAGAVCLFELLSLAAGALSHSPLMRVAVDAHAGETAIARRRWHCTIIAGARLDVEQLKRLGAQAHLAAEANCRGLQSSIREARPAAHRYLKG
jgi:hypothetical protein